MFSRVLVFAAMLLALSASTSAAVASSSPSSPSCDLFGRWVNQRNSTLLLKPSGLPGGLTGEYQSAVGNASGTYALTGSYDPAGCTLGFCVTWVNSVNGNSQSTTCWVGEAQNGAINTMYTLVYAIPPKTEPWRQYITNVDYFRRHA